jgi:tRNA (guanine-N7-)-methyltransferase
VENINRTTDYITRMGQRRAVLSQALGQIIPAHSRLVWEVGCGHGHFLAAYAAAHPDQLCVGIDIMGDRIARAIRKRNRAKLDHLHFVHADANDFLDALPAGVEFAAIHVLFPDPWPKRRHHKNRLMQGAFLDAAAERAGEGARLYFRTDHEAYFAAAAAAVRANPHWRVVEEAWPFELETVFQARAPSYQSLIAARNPIP